MKNILVTGATGNVGSAVISHLSDHPNFKIWKASYNENLSEDELFFDFDNLEKSARSLKDLDVLFLLRPPHISDTSKYFKPLLQACVHMKVKHIVFLSVQGAEKSSIIPHNRIEAIIKRSQIPYTFIRPSYFMQNLTTTLKDNIQTKHLIYLPAGNAKFLWVDVTDIGKAIAVVLVNQEGHQNRTYTITGGQHFTFTEVAALLQEIVDKRIRYESPNVLRFIASEVARGKSFSYSIVLTLLHYKARFEHIPEVSEDFTKLTGTQPNTLRSFISQNKNSWCNETSSTPTLLYVAHE